MPYQNPMPERRTRGKESTGLQSLVQVEKITQIAVILPCAVCIGWLGGMWLDRYFHQQWITLTGFVLGCVAGMTSAIKLAISLVNEPKKKPGESGPKGGSDAP